MEILQIDEDFNMSTEPLKCKPHNARAGHCKTAKELDLFKFSSNYQTYLGGNSDLQKETGIEVGASDGSEYMVMI